jgi:ABC-type uncharacterized transport system substrate-binding protein
VKRLAVALFSLALFAVPLGAEAQPAGKVHRIVILATIDSTWQAGSWGPFRQALHELGYVEGRNLVVEYRSAEGRAERMPALATELVKLKVDVIFAVTTAGALAARNATTMIPIVFTLVSDQIVEARTPNEIDHAFSATVSQRPAALLVDPNVMFYRQRSQIVGLAARHRLPAIYESRPFADAGGLMSFGASFGDLTRREAALVDKVLKGAKPADLPIEGPTKFALVINLKTAKALGLTIPPSVLARSDDVIE